VRKVAGGVDDTLCNGATSSCNALQKVDLNSTSYNVAHRKNIARQPMLHWNSIATCFAMVLRDKLLRKLRSVTASL